jgi:hypothetical protein
VRRALALLLLVLPLAACGGTSDVTSLDPIAQAASKTTNVAGAHFQMNGRITAPGESTFAFSGPGEIADHGRVLHMKMAMPQALLGLKGNGNSEFEVVAAGDSYFLRGAVFDQFAHGKWILVKSNDSNFDLGQSDPARMLQYLRATSDVTDVGKDTVRGVSTTHYSARLQIDKVADRVSADAARALRQMTKTLGTKEIPMDVWVDADGLVRRVKLDWHPKDASFLMTLDLFDFGDVHIDVPSKSNAVDFSNLLGGG